MNIVIFANGERGLNVFNALQKENYNVVAIVTIEKNNDFLVDLLIFFPSSLSLINQ